MHAILADAQPSSDFAAWLIGGGLTALSGTLVWVVKEGLPRFFTWATIQLNKILDDNKAQLAAERQWYERQLENQTKRSDALIDRLSGTVDKIDGTVDKMGDALRAYNTRAQRRKTPPNDQ